MAVSDETSFFGMGQGCPVHGDEHMKECSMCGAEFCRDCFPRASVCPECAEQSEEEDEAEGEENADFDDVGKLDEVLEDDEEAEKAEKDEEEIPPEDLVDDEDRRPF